MGFWEIAGLASLAAWALAPFAAGLAWEVYRNVCWRCRRRLAAGRADKDGRGDLVMLCRDCGRHWPFPTPD